MISNMKLTTTLEPNACKYSRKSGQEMLPRRRFVFVFCAYLRTFQQQQERLINNNNNSNNSLQTAPGAAFADEIGLLCGTT